MLGLEAISAHNGWAMAITGTIIVMCGLSLLAFIISQLHKIIGLFEKRKEAVPHFVRPAADFDTLNDLEAAARIYKPLTANLGDSFHLTELYRIFEKEKLPHPHLTIRALRAAEYLQPLGEGIFCWKNEDQQ
jgi:Na+-transporting methylmalonyl-CoA/oxaloacetate decarboxylase gamma subunit